MAVPKRVKNESLSAYANILALYHEKKQPQEYRRKNGQIFTPDSVAKYMAGLLNITNNEAFRFLDPGSGTGIFTAALIDRLLRKKITSEIQITCIEKDKKLFKLLSILLSECKKEMDNLDLKYNINLINGDYITPNAKINLMEGTFNFVILNPPYYKIKNSDTRSISDSIIHPNIYSLFLEKSLRLLKKDGQCVSITPRSFCSGLYYNSFREWLINNVDVTSAHLFKKRSGLFISDGIQQEVVILKIKKNKRGRIVTITQSDTNFQDFDMFKITKSKIEYQNNNRFFIRLPSSNAELESLQTMDNWPESIQSLGFQVSTGPVVPFRSEEQLSNRNTGKKYVPLIWMNNLKEGNIVWPVKGNGKQIYIKNRKNSSNVLPAENYVLVKRLSSKEQRKRIDAVSFIKELYPYDEVGIENHINYIRKNGGTFSTEGTIGLAAVLNSEVVDNFYRSINGSTQVNAYELSHLPLPPYDIIRVIGKLAIKNKVFEKDLKIDDINKIINEAMVG